MELIGSEGSNADNGMPAACAAASKAAFEALEDEEGLERDLGGCGAVNGDALASCCLPL